MLKELLREIIIAIISNPPEVPEYLRIRPTPIPPIAPPNTVDNKMLSVTATTGTKNKNVESAATQINVLIVIVLLSGFFFTWELALYTMLSIYITGKMIDTIFTDHVKLTMQIVTTKGELIRNELLGSIYRGITITEGYGGYTNEKKDILMMVVTRYETLHIKSVVRKHDEDAFINIYETVEVDGKFHVN